MLYYTTYITINLKNCNYKAKKQKTALNTKIP